MELKNKCLLHQKSAHPLPLTKCRPPAPLPSFLTPAAG